MSVGAVEGYLANGVTEPEELLSGRIIIPIEIKILIIVIITITIAQIIITITIVPIITTTAQAVTLRQVHILHAEFVVGLVFVRLAMGQAESGGILDIIQVVVARAGSSVHHAEVIKNALIAMAQAGNKSVPN